MEIVAEGDISTSRFYVPVDDKGVNVMADVFISYKREERDKARVIEVSMPVRVEF